MSENRDSVKILAESFEEIEETELDSEDKEITIKKIILKNVDLLEFHKEIFSDEQIQKFLEHEDIKDMYAHRIGVEGLLKAFDKEEVCEKITWDYIREYFLDHIDYEDILNHICWEIVSKHFKDYIESENPTEDINNDETESVVEKLNVNEGED
ncbi:MAG: hypothetical protein ACOC56_02430 [Atribacterota bacterium]